ncbi:hypothetical protein C2I27_03740 [Priestia megaterium]|uniref:single-stranded DNA-binding protein n=1 Tax=Priestia megaterium TaxID=1404 RepID=UPI000D50E610|nr:single-stranded DNA-binding protein [Priestia megaterium]PVC75011.1 hypothetical protein C2I27_03740 [Priestia megaterium]
MTQFNGYQGQQQFGQQGGFQQQPQGGFQQQGNFQQQQGQGGQQRTNSGFDNHVSVQAIGRLVKDPESKMVGNSKVATAKIAINHKSEKAGTDFWFIEIWGNEGQDTLHNFLVNHCPKGRKVFVDGTPELRQQQNGNDYTYFPTIKVRNIVGLDGGKEGGQGGGQAQAQQQPPSGQFGGQQQQQPQFQQPQQGGFAPQQGGFQGQPSAPQGGFPPAPPAGQQPMGAAPQGGFPPNPPGGGYGAPVGVPAGAPNTGGFPPVQ